MSRIGVIEARHLDMPEDWTQRDAIRAFHDRAFLLGWAEAQQNELDQIKSELKFLRGERKSLLKHLASWEKQEHRTVGIDFLRRHLSKEPNG